MFRNKIRMVIMMLLLLTFSCVMRRGEENVSEGPVWEWIIEKEIVESHKEEIKSWVSQITKWVGKDYVLYSKISHGSVSLEGGSIGIPPLESGYRFPKLEGKPGINTLAGWLKEITGTCLCYGGKAEEPSPDIGKDTIFPTEEKDIFAVLKVSRGAYGIIITPGALEKLMKEHKEEIRGCVDKLKIWAEECEEEIMERIKKEWEVPIKEEE